MPPVATEVFEGTITTEGYWVPEDPYELAQRMLTAASEYEDVRIPLLEAQQIAIAATRKAFDTETDPGGFQWEELDPEYERQKMARGYSGSILIMTGDLELAAQSEEAWPIVGDTLFFNPQALPRNPRDSKIYGLFHQTGTDVDKIKDAQDFRERLAVGRTTGMEGAQGGMHDNFGIGRGQALPQRRFIGIVDAVVISDIGFVFDEWAEGISESTIGARPTTAFSGGVEYPIISHTTRGQPIVRTPRGPRFGRMA